MSETKLSESRLLNNTKSTKIYHKKLKVYISQQNQTDWELILKVQILSDNVVSNQNLYFELM